ncbi:MAG: hypothetical protein CSA68_07520 [Rhodobacterales bacterium]|nr:MAG: hypothetical protein CSA68_07520 [Rhodobacterales bacterium]
MFVLLGECCIGLEQGNVQPLTSSHTTADQAAAMAGQIGQYAGGLKLASDLRSAISSRATGEQDQG